MTLETKEKLKKLNILHLTLQRPPFDVMRSGEKKVEIRKPSKWIMSRLVDSKTKKNKPYHLICFKNGYNMDSEFFYAFYNGYLIAEYPKQKFYSNGLVVPIAAGDIVISFGKILTLEQVIKYIDYKYGK